MKNCWYITKPFHFEVDRKVRSPQWYGYDFSLQIGTLALYFGKKPDYYIGAQLRIFTPMNMFKIIKK